MTGVSSIEGSGSPPKASRFLPSSVFFFCYFFFVIKHTQHEVYHFNHFHVCNSVALSTFAMLCNHRDTPSTLSTPNYLYRNASSPQANSAPTSRPAGPPAWPSAFFLCLNIFPPVPPTLSPHTQHTRIGAPISSNDSACIWSMSHILVPHQLYPTGGWPGVLAGGPSRG